MEHLAFDAVPGSGTFGIRGVGMGVVPVCLAAPCLEPQFAPVISLDLARAAVALVMWRGFGRLSTALSTDLWPETVCHPYASLRLECGSFIQLVREEALSELPIARAHHDRPAIWAPVFSGKLAGIQAFDVRVGTACAAGFSRPSYGGLRTQSVGHSIVSVPRSHVDPLVMGDLVRSRWWIMFAKLM